MERLKSILQLVLLNKHSIKNIIESESYNLLSKITIIVLGCLYGLYTYVQLPSKFVEFDSNVLQSLAIIVVIIIGIIMVFITKVGLSFLLWAGGKAFGGPGLLRILNRLTSFAIIPIVIGLPAIITINSGESLSSMMMVLLLISVVWIYLISVRILEISQHLVPWKAYAAVIMAFIFFSSIYYLFIPPA